MDSYVDILVHGDEETSDVHVMAALFTRLHSELAKIQSSTLGVSFPNQEAGTQHLGSVLRIHGSASELQRLMSSGWHRPLSPNLTVRAPRVAPRTDQHLRVVRVQLKSGVERLKRRAMKRKGLSETEVTNAYSNFQPGRSELPHLQLRSTSTGQTFPLFIRQEHLKECATGTFNAYGLSLGATVPYF